MDNHSNNDKILSNLPKELDQEELSFFFYQTRSAAQEYHTIACQPIYQEMTGSYLSGVVLSQIIWWCDNNGGEFEKSDRDFAEWINCGYDAFLAAKNLIINKLKLFCVKKGRFGTTVYYSTRDSITRFRESFSKNKVAYPPRKKKSYFQNNNNVDINLSKTVDKPMDNVDNPNIVTQFTQEGYGKSTIRVRENPQPYKDILDNKTNHPCENKSRSVEQGMDGFKNHDEEFERQAREFRDIFPNHAKKAGIRLVRDALKKALVKKSFEFLAEHARNFVGNCNTTDKSFVTCAHTWLNTEMWPKEKPPSTYAIFWRIIEEKTGKENFDRYFGWKNCRTSLDGVEIILDYHDPEKKDFVQRNFWNVLSESRTKIPELIGKKIILSLSEAGKYRSEIINRYKLAS